MVFVNDSGSMKFRSASVVFATIPVLEFGVMGHLADLSVHLPKLFAEH